MPQQNSILLQKLERTVLTDKQKQKLVFELKVLKGEQLEKFSTMMHRMDAETIELLNKKLKEGEHLRNVMSEFREGIDGKRLQHQELQKFLFEIFFDPQKMAEVIVFGTDEFLALLEKILLEALKNHPEYAKEFSQFFQEIRIYKALLDSRERKAYREALMEAIWKAQYQQKGLEQVIQLAQKSLKKKAKRTRTGL